MFVLVVLFFPRGTARRAASGRRDGMSMLEVRDVDQAVRQPGGGSDVSLSVAPGELRAIIGPNGAGKTTFFNLITGFFPPTAGADRVRRPATSPGCRRTQRVKLGMAAPSRSPRSSPS